jgi:spermidine/putrescine transport system permease protein
VADITGARYDRRRRWTPYLLLLPGLGWLGVFFVAPLIQLASTSVETELGGDYLGFGYYEQTYRFANYVDAAKEYAAFFARSFLYAGLATLIAFAIAYPLAYTIAFKSGRWKNLLLVLVVAPFFTSFILRTIAWRQILSDDQFVVQSLRAIGVLGPNGRITETAVAVVAGLAYNFLPFMTLPIYASLERLDIRLIEAGGDLYANAFTTFRKVTFPLSLPGVVAGTLLTFIPAAGDYVNADLLGTDRSTKMLGNAIDSQFFKVSGGYPIAASLSIMLMAAILLLVSLYIRRAGTEELV